MAELVYTDQSAELLNLNLVKGAVDKNKLTVLSTGAVEVAYGKIEVGIIGASHYLEFSCPEGSVVLTEVFACLDLSVSEKIFSGKLNELKSVQKQIGEISYSFNAKRFNWKNGKDKFYNLLNAISFNENHYNLGLQFVFPSEGLYEFSPITAVFLKVNPDTFEVKLETLHAYPNEDSLVFTETILSKGK